MTPQEGRKRVKKLLGDKAVIRTDERAPRGDDREQMQAAARDARDLTSSLNQQLEERKNALLRGDLEYQALLSQWKEARKTRDDLWGALTRHRVTIGINKSWCVEILAQGDNWAEAVRKLEEKRGKS